MSSLPVIALFNDKGGVGETSLVYAIDADTDAGRALDRSRDGVQALSGAASHCG